MFKGTIEKRVMRVMKEKIESAERFYREECISLEDRLLIDQNALASKCEDEKNDLANKLVSSIIG